MDNIGLKKRVALENDQSGHVSLNLLCLSSLLRTSQIVIRTWYDRAEA